MSQGAQMTLYLNGDVLQSLHLLLETLFLSILLLCVSTNLLVLLFFLLLVICVLVSSSDHCQEDHVTNERDQQAECDHPELKEPHSTEVADQGSSTFWNQAPWNLGTLELHFDISK